MVRALVLALLVAGCGARPLVAGAPQPRTGARVAARIEPLAPPVEGPDETEARAICAGLEALSDGGPACRAAAIAMRRDDATGFAALVHPDAGVYVSRGTANGGSEARPYPAELRELIARDGGLRRYLRVWPNDGTVPIRLHERSERSYVLLTAGGDCRHATLRFEPVDGVWRLLGITAWGCS